jgi:protein subunit release factor B
VNPYRDLGDDELLGQCRVETRRASGPGGQHRNKVETAVRLTHRPTGLVATASERRSQRANRDLAVERLRAKLERRFAVRTPRRPTRKSAAVRARERAARQRAAARRRERRPGPEE